ncbi:MAG: PA2169 family four-helix-bundle protein [Pyrinomonadaceae bacterium]
MINDYEATKPIIEDATMNDTANTTESNDDVISCLNGLVEICKDGQDGFKDAAEGVERSELKTVFYEFSQQRSEFVGVLQGLIRNLGGDPETTGSVAGAVHRGWINIKSAVTGKDEEAILNECERGEDYAKEAYGDAQKKNLPANVSDVIGQQAQAVQAAHNRVKALRNTENNRAANG